MGIALRNGGLAIAVLWAGLCFAAIQAEEPSVSTAESASAAAGAAPVSADEAAPTDATEPKGGTAQTEEKASDDESAPMETEAPIDFFVEIQPILQKNCVACHGPEKRSGGLRLDTREFAEAGGDSGKPILMGSLEDNELYQRVASQDRSYRMPKNKDPLSADQIKLIERWVEQGTVWPRVAAKYEEPWYLRWLGYTYAYVDRYKNEVAFVRPFAIAFIVAQCLLLLVARCKGAFLAGKPWTQGRARRWCQVCSRVSRGELTLVWMLLLTSLISIGMFGHMRQVRQALAEAQHAQSLLQSPWSRSIFGNPPVPIRPDHPAQVTRTYYRGNCERNPQLFNGGNYLTALFQLAVCDDEHQTLNVGDPPPAQGQLWMRVETERAPGTADALFSQQLMDAVYFSQEFYEPTEQPLRDKPVHLETVTEGQRWVAYVPIGRPDEKGQLSGLIYMYTGRIDKDMARGEPHYAVKYSLQFTDGKLADVSDVWMNSFGNPMFAMPDPPGKRPYREWFDYRPMPVIVGENTQDPQLLGVEEYIRKGLISAGQVTPTTPTPPQEATPPAGSADKPGATDDHPGEEKPPSQDEAPGGQGNE